MAAACVVLVVMGAVNPKKVETPFGCSYNEIYQFTEDYQFVRTDAEAATPNVHKSIRLTEENFDAYFLESAFRVNKEEVASSLRENNEKS